MSRPYDWYPLAATDPVPGNHEVVAKSGKDYQDVAAAIGIAAKKLGDIAKLRDMDSKAVKAIADHAGDVATEISAMQRRYQDTGDALAQYAPLLHDAQKDADAALTAAQSAQSSYDTAQHRHSVYSDPANASDPNATTHAQQASDDMDSASSALGSARDKLAGAVAARDRAAEAARSTIDDAVSADKVKDGWWQKIRDVVNTITDIASTIASVAGVLALVLAWVPGLGEALAAVAIIAGVVSLIGHGLQLLGGEGSWVDFGLDVLGLATFGLGRVAGSALKVGAEGVEGASRVRADQFVRIAGKSRGSLKSAVKSLLGGKGLRGIKAGEKGVKAFLTRGPLYKSALHELNPLRATKDVFGDLKGFSKTAKFLRNPAQTWKTAFTDVKGVQGGVLTFFGAGDEARKVSKLAFADPSVREAATNLPEHASHALRDGLAASKGTLDHALKYASTAGRVMFVGTGADTGSAIYQSHVTTPPTVHRLVDQATGRDPLNLN